MDVAGVRSCISVCEDIWREDGPPTAQAEAGAVPLFVGGDQEALDALAPVRGRSTPSVTDSEAGATTVGASLTEVTVVPSVTALIASL